ncbi:MAG: winged helix-turn-helix domain-containing protein [Chloroflexi bacterium]|nr:winged helix-turn-helix domain-containing protein [Chloroflexota bacterium]
MSRPYPNSALRALALWTQGLNAANGAGPAPDRESVFQVADRIGCVQIDTLQMVARAHYLTVWSRLGAYDMADFDALAFDPSDRRLFEGWQHAASYIPTHEYCYQAPHQRRLREGPNDWYTRWLAQTGHPETIAYVRERIGKEGALKVSDFERGDHPKGSWWNWRPAKVALEYLYAFGELMIANREKFQRVYDQTGRVLPAWVDRSEPTAEERNLAWVEKGAKALGVCTAQQAGDYTWMKVAQSRPAVAALLSAGTLLTIPARLADGTTGEYLIHRDNLPLLEQAADGAIQAERTTFLNPFDNLFWARKRDQELWGFEKSFEAYVPAAKRKYGYFCLNILHRDRLVGRFDPKLERKTRTLHLKALYLEPGVKPSEGLVDDVAAALRDFMQFHGATDLVIENSQPETFGRKLAASL